jgi:hypothetical protein
VTPPEQVRRIISARRANHGDYSQNLRELRTAKPRLDRAKLRATRDADIARQVILIGRGLEGTLATLAAARAA